MKAAVCTRYGPPEVLQIVDIEKPVPKADELLIRVRATTVAVADSRIRSFNVPKGAWLPARLALGIIRPRRSILGVELAGDVEAVGNAVTRFKKGDAVFAATLNTFGGHAEYVCVKADGPIAPLPAGATYEEAAALPIGGRTAAYFLRKAGVASGKQVLVYGASGSVGTYAVQLAKHLGAQVTAVCSGANIDLVKSLGADEVIDYTAGDYTRNLGKYDIVFLAIDKCPFSVCKQHLKEDGVYVNVTLPVPSPDMLWTGWTTKKRIITGGGPPETKAEMMDLKTLVEAGVLKPVIDRRYALDQIVEAHRYVDAGHKKGNVVVTI